MRKTVPALLFALLNISSAASLAKQTSAPIPPPQPSISITFDDTAVRQLLTMVEQHDLDDGHLEAWLDLPANKHLLEVGDAESNLTRAQLKANAIEAIKGLATTTTQPFESMGCMRIDSTKSYEAMLGGLEASSKVRTQIISAHDKSFSPAAANVTETVYFHLGGDWDAINYQGNVYINIRYWREGRAPAWDGLNMIIAHETMHTIQNQTYGNPQYQDTGDKTWLTALSKIQREGTARLVEYDTDPGPYRPDTYGFFERAIDSETLRRFPRDIAMLGGLYDSCFPTLNHEKFENEFTTGMNLGGPYYDIGHGIAKAIDDNLGRKALIDTISGGPKPFFSAYIDLCRTHGELPKLPDKVAAAVKSMAAKVGEEAKTGK